MRSEATIIIVASSAQRAVIALVANSLFNNNTNNRYFPEPIYDAAEIKTIFWDGAKREMAAAQPMANAVQKVEKVSDNRYKIQLPDFEMNEFVPEVGMMVTVGARYYSEGGETDSTHLVVGPSWGTSTSLMIYNSSAVVVENVTVLGGGNFGVLESGGECGHVYNNLRVDRRGDDSKRLLGVNIDAFHSWGCGVGPTISDSVLANSGDDAFNIHGQVFMATSTLGGVNASVGSVFVVDYGNGIVHMKEDKRKSFLLESFSDVEVGAVLDFFDDASAGARSVGVAAVERTVEEVVVRGALALAKVSGRFCEERSDEP